MTSAEVVKFLVVDDLEENLVAMEALLRRDGLEIVKAKSGVQALELLLVHEFALALLDVQMADMDGFELAELMRSTERTRRIPIIFLTAVATDDRRRFRGYEAGAIDYLFKPVDPHLLHNKADVFFELARQKMEVARQRDELRSRGEQLSQALAQLQAHRDNSPLGVVQFDADFRIVTWSKGAERMFGWNAAEVLGTRLQDLAWVEHEMFAAMRAEFVAGRPLRSVLTGRASRKDGAILDCEWYFSALPDAAGRLISMNAQILDVTARRRAEETQVLLIGELNHRVKNMLSTIQSIATQTLRHSANPSEFADKFSGRIQSLAQTHALLGNAAWQGTTLSALVHDQMQLGIADESRFAIAGPDVRLSPQMAFHLALILYELGTNATKHGSLSVPDGKVAIDWTLEDGRLQLNWSEHRNVPVQKPSKRGFGTTLIERSTRAEGGSAEAVYGPDGMAWHIALPLPPESMPPLSAVIGSEMEVNSKQLVQPTGAEARAETRLGGKRILVVEDEALIGLELAAMLEDAGAEVVGPTTTVEHALEIIETAPIDAALLDGNLHGHPVDEIAAMLRKLDVPFLFVSGYGADNLPQRFRDSAVLSKPFTEAQLIEKARRLFLQSEDIT